MSDNLQDLKFIKDNFKRLELIELYDFYSNNSIDNYLYKWHKEEIEKYNWRKNNSYFKNFISPIINGLTNLLFIKSHELELNEDYLNDIDLNGTPLNKFMQNVVKNSLLFGLTFIYSDTNKTSSQISIADEKNLNIRGFLREFTYLQLINWRYEDNKIKSIVFEDSEYIHINDFKSELVKVYYHLYIGGGSKYIERNNKIELAHSWNNSLDFIPINIIYGTPDSHLLNANSIVNNIQKLNKSHYNLNSGIMNISHIASNPVPIIYGYPQNMTNDNTFKLGVNSLIVFPTNQGNAYNFEWKEIDGKSVEVAERELERLENYIIEMSFDILRVEKFQTATEAKIKENKNKSIISLIINSLESGINKALEDLNLLTGHKIGEIKLNRDISNITLNSEILNAIITLRNNGDISQETIWKILEEGEIFKIEDYELEKERIKNEFEGG